MILKTGRKEEGVRIKLPSYYPAVTEGENNTNHRNERRASQDIARHAGELSDCRFQNQQTHDAQPQENNNLNR